MRAFTDEQLAKLLLDERVKLVTQIEKELDQWVTIVRRTDVHMIERLRDRIVGLLADMEHKPTQPGDGNVRRQAGWESSERPEHERRISKPDGQGTFDEEQSGTERAEATERDGASGKGIEPHQGKVEKKIDCGDLTRPEELTG